MTDGRRPGIGGIATARVLAAVLLFVVCSQAGPLATAQPTSDASLTPSAAVTGRTPDPCPAATPVPAEPSLPADVDDATREAIRIRAEYGLRRDLAWIRQVADDSAAASEFGTPMLPSETAALFARHELADPVRRALDTYGHADELGGLYIDNAAGGVVVVLWTTDPALHAAAIRSNLPACHPVVFRQVRWAERELRQWQDRIAADVDWMAGIPAIATGIGVDVIGNVVEVDVSSAASDASDRILAHYAAPTGMIRVNSDGTGAELLPTGTVVGRVLRADGRPPGPNDLMLDAGSPDDPPGWCGGGDIGYGVLEDGRIEFPCKAGRRTIRVRDWVPDGNGDHPIVASVVVDVPAGGDVEVEIRLPEGFDPAPE